MWLINNNVTCLQASLSLPGSPFNLRRGSRGSHQYKYGRRYGDKKPLVLSTYMDAQEHLPYADDSTAATPMSEENGAIIVPIYNGTGMEAFQGVFMLRNITVMNVLLYS